MTDIEMPDAVHAMLCERIETLESERDALAEENEALLVEYERLFLGVKEVRDFAGDRLPAIQGLTVVAMLETVMRRAG